MIINVYLNNKKVNSHDLNELIESDYVENFSFLIGRSSDCRVQLEDKQVSRNHCELIFSKKSWTLKKMSPFASILFEGRDVSEINLQTGHQVEIAPYMLEFDFQKQENEDNHLKNINTQTILADDSKSFENQDLEDEASDSRSHESNIVIQEEDKEEVESLDSLEDNTIEVYEEDESFEDNSDSDETEAYEGVSNEFDDGEYSDNEDGEYQEDFSEENYEMEESGGEKTQVFSGFADYDLEIFGEFAPYDRFSIGEGEIVIGRDEGASDIFLNDSEVSSKHAKIIKTKISLRIVDLNSANGTLLNGSRVNESDLQSGDEFIIGSTTFTVHIRSDMIQSEKDRLLPVEENQVVEVEEVVEVDEDVTEAPEIEEEAPKSLIGKFKKLPPKKQKIYGAVALLLVFLLLDSEEEPSKIIPGKKPKSAASKSVDGANSKKVAKVDSLSKLTLQEREVVASKYQLAFEFIQQGKYSQSLSELDYVMKLAPDYKQARSLYQMAREGLAKLEELEKKRIAEIEAKKRQEKINKLLENAQKYVKERQVQAAEGIFSKILELDPENFDVPQLKLEINAWKREQERIAMEKQQKDADRKRKLGQIAPSRTFYGKEEWYKAILKIEEFLRIKNMDEDLVKEATTMLKESKNNLKRKIDPMVGKARSLKEGQDLKAAYEQYLDILNFEPTNIEALDEMNDIRDVLTLRSQKVYRDGLISESLMLYKEAKEKFQEVQQISPSDSDYYKKASLKLREYLE